MQKELKFSDRKQEQEDNVARHMAKRTAKNSVFLDLFQNKSNLLKLYQTLHPEDITATEDSLTDVTIEKELRAIVEVLNCDYDGIFIYRDTGKKV